MACSMALSTLGGLNSASTTSASPLTRSMKTSCGAKVQPSKSGFSERNQE